jgi:tetratricopeptide (TPR) repeat protein/ferredoxin
MMKKIGIHPKPFRSRLLVIAPLLLALYMFVWPTFKREVVKPLFLKQWGTETKEQAYARWDVVRTYLGDAGPRPGLRTEFMTDDFWKTFAAWYIAIPFFGVCGFAIVYFLGSKGFCTYGCPYGGFFGPADLIAPGKIVVNENCNQCGHCTAVCTSNVRVHEDVRDFGKVVDPGCMKCMDCVSVCPNEALAFKFAAPTVASKPRANKDKAARAAFKRNRQYDLTVWEEVWVGLVFLLLTLSFRSMLEMIPLLMAMGMGAIGAFLAWKLWRVIKDQNVRLAHGQLRSRGNLTLAGCIFLLLTPLYLLMGAWSGTVRFNLFLADLADNRVKAPAQTVLAPGYKPDPSEKALAERAIVLYTRSLPADHGGFGWKPVSDVAVRLAWLHAVAGRLDEAIKMQEWAAELAYKPGKVNVLAVLNLAQLRSLRGDSMEQIRSLYQQWLDKAPGTEGLAAETAGLSLQLGHSDDANAILEQLIANNKFESGYTVAGEMFTRMGRSDRAIEVLSEGVKEFPKSAQVRATLALAYWSIGQLDKAEPYMLEASRIDPKNVRYLLALADLLREMGKSGEAVRYDEAARLLQQKNGKP